METKSTRSRRIHHANGEPCDCDMKWSNNPTEYVRLHPNKRGADGQTFNDAIAESIRSRA